VNLLREIWNLLDLRGMLSEFLHELHTNDGKLADSWSARQALQETDKGLFLKYWGLGAELVTQL
jgi:hypothetical protein